MSSLCDKLYLFVDGELPEAEAEHVRCHLADCSACAARFQEAVQLELLASEAFPAQGTPCEEPARQAGPGAPNTVVPSADLFPSPAVRQPSPVPKTRHLLRSKPARRVSAMAAVALAALIFVLLPSRDPSPELWLAEAPTRKIEARLSFAVLNRYRPYEPMRSGNSSAERISLSELSRLDEKKDATAIAAAFLVHGDEEQARSFLETAPASPDRDNDLAVVAMQRHDFNEALRLLDQVLQAAPDHAQALWNRALVLRELGRKEEAAAAFEQIAARHEPGWSEEAARNARALRGQ